MWQWSKVEQSLGPVIRTLRPLRPCLVGLCLPARSVYLFRKHARTDLETHVLETPSVIAATEYYLRYVVPEYYGMLWVGDAPPDRRLVQYDISQPRFLEVAPSPSGLPSPHESAQAGVEVKWAVASVGREGAGSVPAHSAVCLGAAGLFNCGTKSTVCLPALAWCTMRSLCAASKVDPIGYSEVKDGERDERPFAQVRFDLWSRD
jgi:hypothetical protein